MSGGDRAGAFFVNVEHAAGHGSADFDEFAGGGGIGCGLHEDGFGLLHFELGDLQGEAGGAELVDEAFHAVVRGIEFLRGDGALRSEGLGPGEVLAGELELG